MKNILVLIHDDEGQEGRVQAALDLARALDGHLLCLDLTIIPHFAGDYVGQAGVLFVDEQKREAANKIRMIAKIEREDVLFTWIDTTGFVAQAIEDHTALIDLIVLSSDAEGKLFPHMAEVIADLLMRIAKPILVMPVGARGFNPQGCALLAWDGSGNAEAVLRSAVPLLRHAERVTLLQVGETSREPDAEDAARYLSSYEIKAVIKREDAGIESAGKAILAEIVAGGHDYLLMGAFGHAPLMEKIFGGTTHRMLHQSSCPVLLAHHR